MYAVRVAKEFGARRKGVYAIDNHTLTNAKPNKTHIK